MYSSTPCTNDTLMAAAICAEIELIWSSSIPL